MKKVLVWGYFNSDNFGDELLLKSTLKALSTRNDLNLVAKTNLELPEFKNVASIDLEGALDVVGRPAITRWLVYFFKLIVLCKEIDYVIYAGGTVFDTSRGIKGPFVLAMHISIFLAFRVRVLGVGNGFNRGNSFFGDILYRLIFRAFTFLSLRDASSFSHTKTLLRAAHVTMSPDLVFLNFDKHLVVSNRGDGAQVAITFAASDIERFRSDPEFFRSAFKEVFRYCDCMGFEPIFYRFQRCEKDKKLDDASIFVDLFPEYRGIKVLTFTDLQDAREALRSVSFVAGMRFHGHVLAVLHGLPFYSISKDHKCTDLSKLFNMPFYDGNANLVLEHLRLVKNLDIDLQLVGTLREEVSSTFDRIVEELR